jgi:hypothetical protein
MERAVRIDRPMRGVRAARTPSAGLVEWPVGHTPGLVLDAKSQCEAEVREAAPVYAVLFLAED